MNTSLIRRRRSRSARIRALGWLAVTSSLALALLAPSSAVFAASVTPSLITETRNIPCSTLDDTYGGGQTWLEIKADPNGDGTYGGVVTISNSQGDKTFDWTSTIGIDAVYVKAGDGGSYIYVYASNDAATEWFGDTGLTTPGAGTSNEISHIAFCYDTANPPQTTSSTTTSSTTTTETTTETTTAQTTTAQTTTVQTTTVQTAEVLDETSEVTAQVLGETGTPRVTLPPTSTFDGGSTPNTDSWRLVLIGFAALMAGLLVLTPGDRKVRADR